MAETEGNKNQQNQNERMTTPYQEEEGEDGELKKEIGVISMVAIGRENHEIQSCYNQSCQDSSGSTIPQQEKEGNTQSIDRAMMQDTDNGRRGNSEVHSHKNPSHQNPSENSFEREVKEQRADASSNETISVNADECEHMLKDMGFNARSQLKDALDMNGIEILIQELVTVSDFIDIWRACNGGNNPAMGLLVTLGQSHLTTLSEFEALITHIKEPKDDRFLHLLPILTNCSDEVKHKRLDLLPFKLLGVIASEISACPLPVHNQGQPLWKTIADEAGFNMQSIYNLDRPAAQSQQRESMTMAFIKIVNQRYPRKNVAWLAQGLKLIKRIDVLYNERIFRDCRKKGCLKVIK